MRQVTVAQWGDEIGLARQSAYRAAERCGIPINDGKVDAEAATIIYNSRTRPHASKGRGQGGDAPGAAATHAGNDANLQGAGPGKAAAQNGDGAGDYWPARTRRERAEADLAELKLAEQRRELVRRDLVERAVFEAARGLRDGMTNCSRRLAAEVAALADPVECDAVIAREHRHLLHAFAQTLQQQLGSADGAGQAALPSPAETTP